MIVTINFNYTTFLDIISLGRIDVIDSFSNVLREEIKKGNKIIINKEEPLIDISFPLKISTIDELDEFLNQYFKISN